MRFNLKEVPEDVKLKVTTFNSELIKPSDICKHLDEYVIGQEDAKKTLSLAAANYMAIVKLNEEIGEKGHTIKQPNVLLAGPSGSGKTLLIETLARFLKLPYVSVDATHFSPSGYKGNDVSNIIHTIMSAAHEDPSARSKDYVSGIVFVDEIDKIAGGSEEFSTTQIQRELLKMVEGGVVTIESKTNGTITVDTRNILWIFGGSFSRVTQAHEKKLEEPVVGFVNNKTIKEPAFDHDSLIKYGLMPELVGRISLVTKLHKLTKEDFRRILLESSSSPIDVVLKVAEVRGLDVSFTDEEINEIIESAYSMGTGARALRTLVEKLSFDKLYN